MGGKCWQTFVSQELKFSQYKQKLSLKIQNFSKNRRVAEAGKGLEMVGFKSKNGLKKGVLKGGTSLYYLPM